METFKINGNIKNLLFIINRFNAIAFLIIVKYDVGFV